MRLNVIVGKNVSFEYPYKCQPTDTAVKIPGGYVYPDYVKSKRCMGSCFVIGPDVVECAARRTKIRYVYITKFSGPKPYVIAPIVEHIDCQCQCRTKPSDCNPLTERFDNNDCSCKCINRGHTCNPSIMASVCILLSILITRSREKPANPLNNEP